MTFRYEDSSSDDSVEFETLENAMLAVERGMSNAARSEHGGRGWLYEGKNLVLFFEVGKVPQ